MKKHSLTLLIPGLIMFATCQIAFGADSDTDNRTLGKPASRYFGGIDAPCVDPGKCQRFNALVMCATSGEECVEDEAKCDRIDTDCVVGQKILQSLYGGGYRQNFPDFIVFLDDKKSSDKIVYWNTSKTPGNTFTLKYHQPLLMWDGKNTPHLMGARFIHILALARHKLDIGVRLTSERIYEPNPFGAIASAIKAPDIKASEAKPSESKEAEKIVWSPLNGNEDDDTNREIGGREMVAWLATTKIEVPENSINRITVSYGPAPNTTAKAANESKKGAADGDKDTADTATSSASDKDKYSGNFLGETGHFSNSPEAYAAISLVLGGTFNAKNTSIAAGGSDIIFDGFVCAKLYFPQERPYLYAAPEKTRYHHSVGFVLGTSVKDSFKNIVVGVSFGQLIGNVGVVVGMNSVEGGDGGQGRKQRAFAGLEYTF